MEDTHRLMARVLAPGPCKQNMNMGWRLTIHTQPHLSSIHTDTGMVLTMDNSVLSTQAHLAQEPFVWWCVLGNNRAGKDQCKVFLQKLPHPT